MSSFLDSVKSCRSPSKILAHSDMIYLLESGVLRCFWFRRNDVPQKFSSVESALTLADSPDRDAMFFVKSYQMNEKASSAQCGSPIPYLIRQSRFRLRR